MRTRRKKLARRCAKTHSGPIEERDGERNIAGGIECLRACERVLCRMDLRVRPIFRGRTRRSILQKSSTYCFTSPKPVLLLPAINDAREACRARLPAASRAVIEERYSPHCGLEVSMIDDPYAVLGVARDASAGQIHEAYFALARQCHPDARPDDPLAGEKFRRVHAAFEVLDCPAARAKYDLARHPAARPVTAMCRAPPAAPTVNWEYLFDRARRHIPDPCARRFALLAGCLVAVVGHGVYTD